MEDAIAQFQDGVDLRVIEEFIVHLMEIVVMVVHAVTVSANVEVALQATTVKLKHSLAGILQTAVIEEHVYLEIAFVHLDSVEIDAKILLAEIQLIVVDMELAEITCVFAIVHGAELTAILSVSAKVEAIVIIEELAEIPYANVTVDLQETFAKEQLELESVKQEAIVIIEETVSILNKEVNANVIEDIRESDANLIDIVSTKLTTATGVVLAEPMVHAAVILVGRATYAKPEYKNSAEEMKTVTTMEIALME